MKPSALWLPLLVWSLGACAAEVPPPKPAPPVKPAEEIAIETGQICSEVKSPEGETLHRVVVRRGAKDACKDLESQAGRPYHEDTTDRDLRALFGKDLYSDVVVVLEETPAGRVLAFECKLLPAIESITFEGATAVDRKGLLAAFGLEGKGYKPSWAQTGADYIAENYREQGYRKARVDVSAKEVTGGGVALTVRIAEGPRSLLRSVQVLGNKTLSEEDIQKAVTDQLGHFFGDGHESYSAGLITAAYRDKGKVRAEVSVKEVKEQADGAVNVTLSVEEGPTFRIGKLSLEGDPCAQDPKVKSSFKGLKTGNVLLLPLITADLRAIETACKTAGKPGRAEPDVTIDDKKRSIALKIRFVADK